jgi:hypothetical protein
MLRFDCFCSECLRELSKGTGRSNSRWDYESEFEKILVVIISLVFLLTEQDTPTEVDSWILLWTGLQNEFEEYSGISARMGSAFVLEFPCGNFRKTCSTSLDRRRWNRCHLA